jgi:hypothetical protein
MQNENTNQKGKTQRQQSLPVLEPIIQEDVPFK